MKVLYYIVIVLFFLGCKKEPIKEDYREPYTGLFNFTTIEKGISMCYDSSATCIDGWETVIIATSFISSSVESIDTNRIGIKFGNGIIGTDDKDSVMEQTIYPILLPDGELSLPEYPIGAGYFKGYYIGFDTLILDIRFGYGIGAYKKFEVLGVREN